MYPLANYRCSYSYTNVKYNFPEKLTAPIIPQLHFIPLWKNIHPFSCYYYIELMDLMTLTNVKILITINSMYSVHRYSPVAAHVAAHVADHVAVSLYHCY